MNLQKFQKKWKTNSRRELKFLNIWSVLTDSWRNSLQGLLLETALLRESSLKDLLAQWIFLYLQKMDQNQSQSMKNKKLKNSNCMMIFQLCKKNKFESFLKIFKNLGIFKKCSAKILSNYGLFQLTLKRKNEERKEKSLESLKWKWELKKKQIK